MQPIMTTPNGIIHSHVDDVSMKKKPVVEEDKVKLPVEMASMVPLRALIGKLIHKSYADLMTLTDTLPSMSDVEKKRQILTYSISVRKQFLKLLVLVKWAENANDIQMCQNIMAFLANQNKIFQDTVDYLHNIHVKLPAARLRNFDIPTAVDVLTTGTYQRMPTKIKDMMMPTPLTDRQVLETFQQMNDVIRMRMMTTEVLPSPMQTYRIENGRIYFYIEHEFEVALTLMGHSHDRRWWIVSLDIFVSSAHEGATEDMDISLNEAQKQHVRVNAQKQLVPPEENGLLFFPLVNMYDYLHLCCLNMQLEILYIQAAMLAKTRWINQLKVQMNQERTKLTLVYWRGGSPASRWASQSHSNKNTTIEISIRDADPFALSMSMRDDWKGLIQKAGIGASIRLSEMPMQDRPKVLASLKYPKHMLEVLWDGRPELYTDQPLLNPSHLNVEQLVLHATNHHGQCMINQFRSLLVSQKDFLQENGLYLAEESSLVIRYRHAKYISIESDARTGRVKAFEASDGCHEGDFKLRSLEDKLNNDPEHIARHLLWLRSEVVVREVISLAKQLNLQPYHPSHMNLRPEDIQKLFGDLTEAKQVSYPSHCIFLQFSQFEDWYFVIATVKNQFKSWLCCINKTYDASGLYQTIVDLTYLECDQLWQDQFMGTKRHKKQRLSYEQPIDRLSIDLRYLAKLDSLCQAYIMNRKIELQLQSYRLAYHTRPLLQSLTGIETHGMNHPAADKMEVVCVSQQDVLKTSSGTLDSWVQRLLPLLKNDIMIRSFGWWGQSGDCYVVVQDKLDADALHLKGHALGDHIALDRATGVVSFTYTQIDRCIEQFLVDWERLFMMANLARQVSSVWFKKYKDQLVFEATDLQSLRMTYAKHYGCTIRWDTITKGQQRQYQLDLFTHHTKQTPVTALPTQIRNPHWRIASFLRDVLNDNRDLIYFVQILFQTLPLMSCLERLEVKCIQEGDIGKVSIIPRAYDAVRVIFSSMYAIDIRFTDKSTLCLSDAAYASPFSSSTSSPPPAPYLLPSLQQKSDAISVAQQCKFIPFDQFSQLLDTLDKETFEPSVVPFQHGFLCSSGLCEGILDRLI